MKIPTAAKAVLMAHMSDPSFSGSSLTCSSRDNLPNTGNTSDDTLALFWIAPPDVPRERIDKALAQAWPWLSRSALQTLISAGSITVDSGKPLRPSQRVTPGQVFQLQPPPPHEPRVNPENIPLDILFEDDDLLVVNKPAGLVVHPAAGNWRGTLVNALLYHTRLSSIGVPYRPGIVHRLDKDTSGAMVVAKRDQSHHHLAEQLCKRSLQREYEAIVWGVPSPRQGQINTRVGRHPYHRQRMAWFAPASSKGKQALTEYQVVQTFGQLASRLHCRLVSGRTHQLRVHLCALGHPIIGDRLYATTLSHRHPIPGRFARQALHAKTLFLRHPRTQLAMAFDSKRPADLDDLIVTLRSITSCHLSPNHGTCG